MCRAEQINLFPVFPQFCVSHYNTTGYISVLGVQTFQAQPSSAPLSAQTHKFQSYSRRLARRIEARSVVML